MEEVLGMLRDPSQCKRKKRTSSLTRQNRVGLPPPSNSRPRPPVTTPTNHAPSPVVQDSAPPPPPGEDTLKRRPKRPAPAKPGSNQPKPPKTSASAGGGINGQTNKPTPPTDPSRRAPIRNDPGWKGSLKRPAPVKPPRTKESWRSDSKDDLIAAAAAAASASGATVVQNLGAIRNHDDTSTEKAKGRSDGASGRNGAETPPPPPPPPQLRVDSEEVRHVENNDVEFPENDDDDDISKSMFVDGVPEKVSDDDFILEPPEDFSESSLDDLDDPNDPNDLADLVAHPAPPLMGKKESKKGSASLAIQFTNAASSDEDEDASYKRVKGSSHSDQQKVPQASHESSAKGLPHSDHHKATHEGLYKPAEKHSESSTRSDRHKVSSHSYKSSRSDQASSSFETGSGEVKKPKKRRSSKDYSEQREGHTHKHKSRKKRKSASSDNLLAKDEDVQFPEYEFDRGMDRIPVGGAKKGNTTSRDLDDTQSRHSHQNDVISSGPVEKPRSKQASSEATTSHDSPDAKSRQGTSNVASRGPADAFSHQQAVSRASPLKRHSSYEDVIAGEEYTPPWLDEPVQQSQELSFEELDAYYEPEDLREDTDDPKVVFKADVAALIW